MLFKVRDLLVSILPDAIHGDCEPDTRCNGCTNQYSDCPAGCSNARSDFSENCPEWRFTEEGLGELREILQLAQARAEVAAIEARLEARALDHLEEIEERLRGAYDEIQSQKARLSGQDPPRIVTGNARTFRVNDLLINVLPALGLDAADSGCAACTCAAGCSSNASGCTNATKRLDTLDWDQAQVLPELQVLLADLVARTSAEQAKTLLTSAADADFLGKSIERALDGIRLRREARLGR